MRDMFHVRLYSCRMQRLIVPKEFKIERIVFEMGLMADNQSLTI